jgi:uncharacterized membrane protein YqaE (UPF0057 family)
MATNDDFVLLLLLVFIPPVGVFLKRGMGTDFIINLILTLIGYVPGIIHGVYIYTR